MQERQQIAEDCVFDQTNLLPRKQVWIVLSVLSISLFLSFVDQHGIGIALPTIAKDLDAKATISWAGTSALIANTISQVICGRLSDLFGRKTVLLSALGLLAISGMLCGFSQNATMLYIFRGLAGIANGGIQALVMMTLSDIVTLKKRAQYQGILGAMIALGNMVGPYLAVAFMHTSSWRAFFWLISPLATLCGVLCYFIIPTPKDAPKMSFKAVSPKIDYRGIAYGSAAIILLLIPISGGGHYFAWDSPMVIIMLTIGGCCMLIFLYIEYEIALLPMMPLSLFRNLPVGTMLLQNFCFGIVYYSQIYYLPLFFHNARGFSALTSATLVMPVALGQIVASIASGHCISFYERYGYIIYLGFALWTLGVGLTIIFNLNTPVKAMITILLIQGTGVGLILQPILTALQAHCTKAQRAVVISNRNFLRNLGGAVGLAISAATLQTSLKKFMPPEFAPHGSSTYNVPDFDAIGATSAQIMSIRQAYANASRTVFKLNAPIMGVCLLACVLIRDRGLQGSDEARSVVTGEEMVQAQKDKPDEEDLKGNIGQWWEIPLTNDGQGMLHSKV